MRIAPDEARAFVVDRRSDKRARLVDALLASGLPEQQGWAVETLTCGIWSHLQPLHHLLRDGDRVEIYRALAVDPKEARRLRYKRQRQRPPAGA